MTTTQNHVLLHLIKMINSQQVNSGFSEEYWYSLLEVAESHGLAEWFCYQCQQVGQVAPPEILQRCHTILQTARVRTALQQRAWGLALRALRTAGIDVLAVKGIALAHTIYPVPYLRPMIDLDLLIRAEQREQAVAQLVAVGFRLEEGAPDTLLSQWWLLENDFTHHYVLYHDTLHTTIELHFRLLTAHHPQLADSKMNYFWQHVVPFSPEDDSQLTLEPALHALYLCAHAILQHGEHDFRLLRYLDLHLLVTDTAFDWERFCQYADELGWSYAAYRALEIARDFLQTPIPDQLWSTLRTLSGARNPNQQPREQFILAALQQRSGKLSLVQKVQLFGSILFPPPAYMRQRYQITPGSSLLPYYWRRFWRGIATFLRRFEAK